MLCYGHGKFRVWVRIRVRVRVGFGLDICCCVPLCPCELRYSSSKDISFHRVPGDKVAGRECIVKSRRDMPLL